MDLERAWMRVAALVAAVALSGCKSGTSFTKPSWWTFGGSGDPAKLAAAPPYGDAAKTADGAVQKPSANATPYPTTTTPQGYAVSGTSPAKVAAQTAVPTATGAPVTYGQAAPPPAIAAVTAPPAAAAADGIAAPASAPIGTQAGPYATLPTPSSTPQPMAAVPTPATESAFGSQPLARYADNRPADAIAAPPSAALPPSQPQSQFGAALESPPSTDSRYGAAIGSSFSREPAPFTAGNSSALPYSAPPAAPPAAAPATLPGAPPTRRPDPGYRPGGTSSYRPSRTILVGDPATDSAVRTAAFETSAEPIRQ